MTGGPPTDATPNGGAAVPAAESAPTVVARPGSHRAQRTPYSLVLPVLIVAVSAVAIGVGVYGWLTVDDSSEALPAVPVSSTPSSQPSASPQPSPSPSVTPSPSKSAKPTPTPTSKPSPKPSPKPSTKPSTKPVPVARVTPVIVLNQTSITGLAATTARQLERRGWNVTGLGNWRGDVPETTVYYPSGKQAEARKLARDLGADRVRPRPSSLRSDRLTVILNSRPS